MQTMNLRFEQMVDTAQAIQPEKLQGTNNSPQNDSSFITALEKAQSELNENESAVQTTEGIQNTAAEEKISETELNWLYASDSENLLTEDVMAELSSFQVELNSDADPAVQNTDFQLENGISAEDVMNLIDDNAKFADVEVVQNLDEEIAEIKTEDVEDIHVAKKVEKSEKMSSGEEVLYAVLTGQPMNKNVQAEENVIENQNFSLKKTDDVKTSDEKPLISVIDERTFSSDDVKTTDNFVTTIEKTSDNEVEMSMNLNAGNSPSVEFEGTVSENAPVADNSRFAQMLSETLQTNSADFVKAGSLILKDNNKGTINLVLHPEDLGNVKIQLEMTDKVVAGKIVVATKEAYDAFNQNMNSLRDAFTESGFETGSFDLSWSGQEKSDRRESDRNMYGSIYADNVPEVSDNYFETEEAYSSLLYGSSIVNVVV